MVETGLEVLFAHHKRLFAGKRIGLLANPSAVDSRLRFIVDSFAAENSWTLTALSDPSTACARTNRTRNYAESPPTSGPASRSSAVRRPPPPDNGDAQRLDALIFDIQDVGSRYYNIHLHTLPRHGSLPRVACSSRGPRPSQSHQTESTRKVRCSSRDTNPLSAGSRFPSATP